MSWSVRALGKAGDVAPEIARQFGRYAGIDIPDERAAIGAVATMVASILATFDPQKPVEVGACGEVSFSFRGDNTKPSYSVQVIIDPIHFTVSGGTSDD